MPTTNKTLKFMIFILFRNFSFQFLLFLCFEKVLFFLVSVIV